MQQNLSENTITLPNGQEAINLAPSLGGTLALCHLSVLKRLRALLPEASLSEIKERITDLVFAADSVEAIVIILEAEVAWQKTINVIETVETAQLSR